MLVVAANSRQAGCRSAKFWLKCTEDKVLLYVKCRTNFLVSLLTKTIYCCSTGNIISVLVLVLPCKIFCRRYHDFFDTLTNTLFTRCSVCVMSYSLRRYFNRGQVDDARDGLLELIRAPARFSQQFDLVVKKITNFLRSRNPAGCSRGMIIVGCF